MNTAKKVSWTIAVSMAVGVIAGILYAPCRGAETRRKINKLKQKFSCAGCSDVIDEDRETLEELSLALQQQLDRVNERLHQQK